VVQGHLQSQAAAAVEGLASEICDKIQSLTNFHGAIRSEMLVRINSAAGKKSEVVDMQEEVMDFYCKSLGENHEKTMAAREYLARLYYLLGRFDEAETLLVKIVSYFQETVGKEHPFTLANMVGLATVYQGQGRFEESKQLQDKVLPVYTRLLGRPYSLSYLPAFHHSNL
jgi:tetratricopeptide (TPR) repeat protein